MIVEAIDVRGYGPIKRFKQRFRHENCIVGPNGGGKTTLLSLIAGVCGTDRAGLLIESQPVEYCSLSVREGNETFDFETTAVFDPEHLLEFKKSLPRRVNFGLTEWDQTFASECVSPATARERFRQYCELHAGHASGGEPIRDFVYSPESRSASHRAGDGYKFAMSLFVNDSSDGIPSLFDNPSRHMDIYGKRIMTEMLCREERQLFYTTHCPEMVLHAGWKGENPDQLVVDIPQSSQKNQ